MLTQILKDEQCFVTYKVGVFVLSSLYTLLTLLLLDLKNKN